MRYEVKFVLFATVHASDLYEDKNDPPLIPVDTINCCI